MIRLSDWDNQTTSFSYDKADRHIRTRRSNGLDSLYQHDAAGRLHTLHHLQGKASLRQTFNYTVNALGNRTQAQEVTPRTSGATAIDMTHTYPALVYRGDWNDVGLYHEASVHDASLSILFYGDTATLKMGVGSDYSLFDVYIDGTLWLSFDGYAATEGDMTQIDISVEGAGLHLLEVKNRLEHNVKSTGYKIRFKLLNAQPAFDVTKIDYEYDDISRLLKACYDYDPITEICAQEYVYGYDLSGNLIDNDGVTRTYNAANQMTTDGTYDYTYDANGNLILKDETGGYNSWDYTWDRANRMVYFDHTNTQAPDTTDYEHFYDGLGNRIQTKKHAAAPTTTDYLLDIQPSLVKVLRQTEGANIDHFVHGVRGIHAVDDGTDWNWHTQDGLGSVRGLVDDMAAMVSSHSYNPIGVPDSDYGAGFWFTGEQTDENDNIYLRARYMNPNMGTFLNLDPFEGVQNRPMSLNGYSWVEGNVVNAVDPSGMTCGCEQYLDDGDLAAYMACSSGQEYRVFDFNRPLAARAAWNMSRAGANGLRFEPALTPFSAAFMSLAYYAGGVPMTASSDGNNELGWFAEIRDDKIRGNFVWSNHNRIGTTLYPELSSEQRLIGYLAGGQPRNGLDIVSTPNSVTVTPPDVNTTISSDGTNLVVNQDGIRLITQAGMFATIRQGDYLFIDSSGFTHGYMVVGFGPIVDCEVVASIQDSMSLSGNNVNIPIYHLPERVPYVADWSGEEGRNIIPYYCSRYYFTHNTWTFITVPDRWIVHQDNLFASNFRVTAAGNIIVSGDTIGSR